MKPHEEYGDGCVFYSTASFFLEIRKTSGMWPRDALFLLDGIPSIHSSSKWLCGGETVNKTCVHKELKAYEESWCNFALNIQYNRALLGLIYGQLRSRRIQWSSAEQTSAAVPVIRWKYSHQMLRCFRKYGFDGRRVIASSTFNNTLRLYWKKRGKFEAASKCCIKSILHHQSPLNPPSNQSHSESLAD